MPTEFTVQVTNLTAGPLTPLLGIYVDSVPARTHRVLLEPNEQKAVTVSVRLNEGSYAIRVDRLTASVSVGQAPPPTPTPLPSEETDEEASEQADDGGGTAAADDGGGGVSMGLIAVVVVVVVLIVVIAVVVLKRRKRAS